VKPPREPQKMRRAGQVKSVDEQSESEEAADEEQLL